MNTYTIRTIGCDDATTAYVELSDDEARAVAKVARVINETSEYGCQPRIFIRRGEFDDIDEIDGDL